MLQTSNLACNALPRYCYLAWLKSNWALIAMPVLVIILFVILIVISKQEQKLKGAEK